MESNRPIIKIPEKLTQDCEKCQGLCCMALKHRPQDGFPIEEDKPVGVPCINLETDSTKGDKLYTCKIYGRLTKDGWETCPEYTCNGAGQAVSIFFKELGVSWAEGKPDSYSEEEWRILNINQQRAFQILQHNFGFLSEIKEMFGSQTYIFARDAVKILAQQFSKELLRVDREIDMKEWSQKFMAAIKLTIEEYSKSK